MIKLEDRFKRWSKIMMFRSAAIVSGILLGTVLNSNIADAQYNQLRVHAHDQHGNPMSNAQTILQTKYGNLYGTTDNNGLAVFNNVSDTATIVIAKNNYIGAAHKIVLDSDNDFNVALLDRVQTRTGTNGTGTDTTSIYPRYMRDLFGADGFFAKNPILFDVHASWPNYNVRVKIDMSTGFTSSDSLSIWNDLNWRNSFSGVTMFVPDSVNSATPGSITILKASTNDSQTFTSNGYVFDPISNISAPPLDRYVVHEVSFRDLISPSGTFDSRDYSPTNYNNAASSMTTTRDDRYMYVGYLLQYLRQTGVNQIDMSDYADSIVVQPDIQPSKPALLLPVKNDTTVNTTTPSTFKWSKSIGSNNAWIRYNAHVKGGALDTLVNNIPDTVLVLPANVLKPNTNYTWSITATDNLLSTLSDTSAFKTQIPIPSQPSITQPANGSKNQPLSVVAKWGAVPFASTYHFQLSADSTFAVTFQDTSVVDTSVFSHTLSNNQRYFLRVNATNVSGTGTWSSVTHFTTIPLPFINASRLTFAFGPVSLSSTTRDTVRITNASPNPLLIDSIYTHTQIFSDNPSHATVTTNDTLAIVVTFNPTTIGSFVDTLYLRNNSASPLVKIPLSGICPLPSIQFSTRNIMFGNVGIYDTSSFTIAVTNPSPNPLRVDSIVNRTTSFIPSMRNFSVSSTDTVKLIVRSVPTQYGYQTDSLLVWSNAATYVIYVNLYAFVPYSAILTYPSKIDFGTVRKDTTRQMVFSIQDTSISRLQVDSLWTNSKYFEVVHHLANWIIQKTDSIAISIRFTPDTSGQFIDTLYIANSSITSPAKIPLSGNGTATRVMQYGDNIPTVYALYQNYPNPFNPSTSVSFALPSKAYVSLKVFDILGREVATIVSGELPAGTYTRQWNAANMPSGVYFYHLQAGTYSATKKLILIK